MNIVLAILLVSFTSGHRVEVSREHVVRSSSFRLGRDIFTVQTVSSILPMYTVTFPRVLRNGIPLKFSLPDANNSLRCRAIRWPFPGRLLAVRSYAATSNVTWYYRIDHTGVHGPMAKLDSGLNGGPIYRPLDHNGAGEMIFDDYSYYAEGPLPNHFLVYTVDRKGGVRFLNKTRNPSHRSLRDTTGL